MQICTNSALKGAKTAPLRKTELRLPRREGRRGYSWLEGRCKTLGSYHSDAAVAGEESRHDRQKGLFPQLGSVLSRKFVKKVFLVRDRFSEPRQGRHSVAQGVTCPDAFDREPWVRWPSPRPACAGHPSVAAATGRGDGGEGGLSRPTACAVVPRRRDAACSAG